MIQTVTVAPVRHAMSAKKTIRSAKDGLRSAPLRIRPCPDRPQSIPEAENRRLGVALFSADRAEVDHALHEIARLYPPSESPQRFFGLIGHLIGSPVARAQRDAISDHLSREELLNLALIDDLTGLHNRRGFFALAAQQLKLARRSRRGALLLFLDVNGLKQINDRFGHREGDAAIQRAARILKRTFRDSDIIARLGGDEFAVLANEAGAHWQSNIWRRLNENLKAEGARESRYALSLSVGAAKFDPLSPLSLDELLNSADLAMYAAKRASRNKNSLATLVEASTPPTARHHSAAFHPQLRAS